MHRYKWLSLTQTVGLQVFTAVTRHVDWKIVRCLVIAGPGFTREEFRKYLEAEAVRRDIRYVLSVHTIKERPKLCWHGHFKYCTSRHEGLLVPLWDRDLLTNKQKIITAHASSAYKHALREVLQAQGIALQIKVAEHLSHLQIPLHASNSPMSSKAYCNCQCA